MSAITALQDDVVIGWSFGGFGGKGWTKHAITAEIETWIGVAWGCKRHRVQRNSIAGIGVVEVGRRRRIGGLRVGQR